jgi:hypothetical protein
MEKCRSNTILGSINKRMRTMKVCSVCGEEIEAWEFEDGFAFEYDGGYMHEACREEKFGEY